eukprot:TRINITY_DN26843_c0_g1_i2.p1 TRINITY_DN26843_c0_g1~~TRINITY_DN26843_c0_g1_i2.p1  ORF type:complete len:116 (+),score=14.58 TRINITY_DN26843_c0_g1_i2:75-422(+)
MREHEHGSHLARYASRAQRHDTPDYNSTTATTMTPTSTTTTTTTAETTEEPEDLAESGLDGGTVFTVILLIGGGVLVFVMVFMSLRVVGNMARGQQRGRPLRQPAGAELAAVAAA